MSDKLFGRSDQQRRCIMKMSVECFSQEALNLPPGVRVTGVEWDDAYRLFRIGIEGLACGAVPPEDAPEIEVRVDHFNLGTIHRFVYPSVGLPLAPISNEQPIDSPLNFGPRLKELRREPFTLQSEKNTEIIPLPSAGLSQLGEEQETPKSDERKA